MEPKLQHFSLPLSKTFIETTNHCKFLWDIEIVIVSRFWSSSFFKKKHHHLCFSFPFVQCVLTLSQDQINPYFCFQVSLWFHPLQIFILSPLPLSPGQGPVRLQLSCWLSLNDTFSTSCLLRSNPTLPIQFCSEQRQISILFSTCHTSIVFFYFLFFNSNLFTLPNIVSTQSC